MKAAGSPQLRIVVVGGFFLPIPPVAGGSTEKSWYRLGLEFAARGHSVTMLSRQWPALDDRQLAEGIQHIRLPGHDHTTSLVRNLWLDLRWSLRAYRVLPPADVIVVNTLALPCWLGRIRPAAGRVVLMAGRMPKGQYRFYRRVSRIYAPSAVVRDRIARENPALAPVIRVTGYPLDWAAFNRAASRRAPAATIMLGYVGRIHEEKGLLLLAAALRRIAASPGLPPVRLRLCGPADVLRGGSGAAFLQRLMESLPTSFRDRCELLEPRFDERLLAEVYAGIDIFCYPSLAAKGETFGVAVAEAMAAGAVPVVSALPCFRELVCHERNGLVFDHAAKDAIAQLANCLIRLLRDASLRNVLGAAARQDARRYDFPIYADMLLQDFSELCRIGNRSSPD
jgi:glycosyltransferase involved in cell wall biosynthesis